MGFSSINNKRERTNKNNTREKYSFLSTGTLTYWQTDSNKTPDLLDFIVINGISSEYWEVEPSYDLSSDHSPVIATVCSYVIHKTPRSKLHNQKTNWEEYRMKLQEAINLNLRLKSPMEIDSALTSLINIIKQATQIATHTPESSLQNKTRNVPIQIKKLIAEKRRVRTRWHRSKAPTDKTPYNHISNTLKCKIKKERDRSFTDYITSLNTRRFDNTIWKPTNFQENPRYRYIQ
jgi:hypothetical protein